MSAVEKATPRPCPIEGCHRHIAKAGLCQTRYTRRRYHGTTDATRTPPGVPMAFIEQVAMNQGPDCCLIWPFGDKGKRGYGTIHLGATTLIVSRLVCRMAHGDPPDEAFHAAHSCGNGHLGCITPGHLRWASLKDNRSDMIAHGRSTRGRTHNGKLTQDAVRQIRLLLGTKTMKEIGALYGVSASHIAGIKAGAKWGWVK